MNKKIQERQSKMEKSWKLVLLLILFVSLHMLKVTDYISIISKQLENTTEMNSEHLKSKVEVDDVENIMDIVTDLNCITNSKMNEEEDERPLLLFHIGPPKTGTSAIQCSLTHFGSLLYSQESFTFLGKAYRECQNKEKPLQKLTKSLQKTQKELDTHIIVDCLNNHAQIPCDKTNEWKKFENLLNPLYSNITNIIISDERFAGVHYTSENLVLLHSLLTKNHRTRIVVGYRDYTEWLVSEFNAKLKRDYFKLNDELIQNPEQTFITKLIKMILNRRKGSSSHQKNIYGSRALAADMHPTDWLKRLLCSYFDDVVVFNMHTQNKNNQLGTSFLQSVMPASHAISDATLSKIDMWAPQRPNEYMNIDHSILAEAAYKKGMLENKHITVKEVTKYIKKRCEKEDAEYLMICITKDEQDSLFRLSLSYKRKLFSDKLQGNNDNYQVELLPDVEERFCDIDTEKTLADKGWNKFFKSL